MVPHGSHRWTRMSIRARPRAVQASEEALIRFRRWSSCGWHLVANHRDANVPPEEATLRYSVVGVTGRYRAFQLRGVAEMRALRCCGRC
jgi:hypothetical protein